MNFRRNKKFCPVCKKNGKSEAEYNSHNTRDEQDNILCPILLDVVCNYCKETGHIAIKCPNKRCSQCSDYGHTNTNCPNVNAFRSRSQVAAATAAALAPVVTAFDFADSPSLLKNSLPLIKKEVTPVKETAPSLLKTNPKIPSLELPLAYSKMAATEVKKKQIEVRRQARFSLSEEEIEKRLRNIYLEQVSKENTIIYNRYGGNGRMTKQELNTLLERGEKNLDFTKIEVISDDDNANANDDIDDNDDDEYEYEDV
jgi:hypothetical protein